MLTFPVLSHVETHSKLAVLTERKCAFCLIVFKHYLSSDREVCILAGTRTRNLSLTCRILYQLI